MIKNLALKFVLLSLISSSTFAASQSLTCQNSIIIDSPQYGVVSFTLAGGKSESIEGFTGQALRIKSSNNLTENSTGGTFEASVAEVLQVKVLDTLTQGSYSVDRYAVELAFKNNEVLESSFWAVCTMGSTVGTFSL